MESKDKKNVEKVVAPVVVALSEKMRTVISEKLNLQQRLTAEVNEIILATLEAKEVEHKDKQVSLNANLDIELI
jgi:GTP cyclohydrolase I